jgi:hypothetical protein
MDDDQLDGLEPRIGPEVRPLVLAALRGESTITTLVVDEPAKPRRLRWIVFGPCSRDASHPPLLGATATMSYPVLHRAVVVASSHGRPIWGKTRGVTPGGEWDQFAKPWEVSAEQVASVFRKLAHRLPDDERRDRPRWAPVALDRYAGIALGGDHAGVLAESETPDDGSNLPSKYGWVDLDAVPDGASIWKIRRYDDTGSPASQPAAVWVFTRRGEAFEVMYLDGYNPPRGGENLIATVT